MATQFEPLPFLVITVGTGITEGTGQSIIQLGRAIRDRDGTATVSGDDVTFSLGTTITDQVVDNATTGGRVTVLTGSDVTDTFTSPVVTGDSTQVILTQTAGDRTLDGALTGTDFAATIVTGGAARVLW
jgi:hypothetical protein